MISDKKPLFSEPKCLVTGVEGAGKTLFSVQQGDLLSREEGGELYQVNIRGADPHHLPKLPFGLRDMAHDVDGKPVVDPETGDHLPRWAVDLPPGSVVIVDEAHKAYPQRGPGRPPKDVEMLAEGRQHGIRFIYLSQSPSSLDGFLRDRISRHYHLERKGNLERATVFEFDHCVMFPRTAWQERKDAVVHFWRFPKAYYGWYKSAKSHHFKLRIPLKLWAAIAFVPLAIWGVVHMVGTVGSITEGLPVTGSAAAAGAPASSAAAVGGSREGGAVVTLDPLVYQRSFQPVVETHPWSAPAFQGRAVVSKPEVYCASWGAGVDARGVFTEASCSCVTEQGTRYPLKRRDCQAIVDAGGVYNPFREPESSGWSSFDGGRGKPESARGRALGVPAPSFVSSAGVSAAGGQFEGQARYGQFRDEAIPSDYHGSAIYGGSQ